jgi:hypothetical protein
MFRNTAAAAPSVEEAAPSSLVPLSVLRLEMDPGGDWSAYLAERDVPVLTDAVGRDSVLSSDARALLAEHRERVAAEREAAARRRELLELRLVEQDELRRAQIWQGLPAEHVPEGVAPAAAMLQAAADERPKRTSVLQEALGNRGGFTFHSLAPEGDES